MFSILTVWKAITLLYRQREIHLSVNSVCRGIKKKLVAVDMKDLLRILNVSCS